MQLKKVILSGFTFAMMSTAFAGNVTIPVVFNDKASCDAARAQKAGQAGVISTTSCVPYGRTGKYQYTYTVYQPGS